MLTNKTEKYNRNEYLKNMHKKANVVLFLEVSKNVHGTFITYQNTIFIKFQIKE